MSSTHADAARSKRWIWMLIYGGLLVCALGMLDDRSSAASIDVGVGRAGDRRRADPIAARAALAADRRTASSSRSRVARMPERTAIRR